MSNWPPVAPARRREGGGGGIGRQRRQRADERGKTSRGEQRPGGAGRQSDNQQSDQNSKGNDYPPGKGASRGVKQQGRASRKEGGRQQRRAATGRVGETKLQPTEQPEQQRKKRLPAGERSKQKGRAAGLRDGCWRGGGAE